MPPGRCCRLRGSAPLAGDVQLHAIADAQPRQPSCCGIVHLHKAAGCAQSQQAAGCGREGRGWL